MKEKLRHCSLILKTHQTFHSQSKLVKWYLFFKISPESRCDFWWQALHETTSYLVKYVSPPTWNCVELAQLDMSSQLMQPKALWHPWFCRVLIIVIPCCQGFLNSWLKNFKRFKIVLLDSFSKRPNAHISPLLAKLHWLPIAQRIDYKISSLCYDVVSDTAPLYLSNLLCLYVPSRSLRSSADTRIFRIPTRKKKFQGQRAFSHFGPVTRNKLPYSVRHAQTQSQFKTQLKTTLFHSVYEPDS